MLKRQRKKFPAAIIVTCLFLSACLEPFAPPPSNQSVNFLVIDGFLNSTAGEIQVTLNHAKSLSSIEAFEPDLNAQVVLETEGGAKTPIGEIGGGKYYQSGLLTDSNQKYRLTIKTTNNKEYFSEYISLLQTPEIDNLTWEPLDDGVSIKVNTHDASNKTRYYHWRFEETWEYQARYFSAFKVEDGIVSMRKPNEQFYTCWISKPSTQILVASSNRLTNDIISNFQINFIPKGSQELGIKYSILAKQVALTREAYDFWSKLEQTTEGIGGLFDPQPGKVLGNVYCASDPNEIALGYFEGGSVNEERIFISRTDLPGRLQGFSPKSCRVDTVSVSLVGSLSGSNSIINQVYENITLVGYAFVSSSCADCRSDGGDVIKPSFWK